MRAALGRLLQYPAWVMDEKEACARRYRAMQQEYIHQMVQELQQRIANGDVTPSILGNMLRLKLLKEEEVLLASYTGSKCCSCI